MPETPEEFYQRVSGSLRVPTVQEWDTFPFEGDIRPRALEPPVESEPPRRGEGGFDCPSCAAGDDEYIWTNERWRLLPLPQTPGLPVVVMLESREHHGDPGELSDEVAADLGVMLARVERAVRSVGEIGRVHICRYGDGSEHMHWWFFARPARVLQLRGSFAAIWDDILPPLPEDVWRANLEVVVEEMAKGD